MLTDSYYANFCNEDSICYIPGEKRCSYPRIKKTHLIKNYPRFNPQIHRITRLSISINTEHKLSRFALPGKWTINLSINGLPISFHKIGKNNTTCEYSVEINNSDKLWEYFNTDNIPIECECLFNNKIACPIECDILLTYENK